MIFLFPYQVIALLDHHAMVLPSPSASILLLLPHHIVNNVPLVVLLYHHAMVLRIHNALLLFPHPMVFGYSIEAGHHDVM